MNRRHFLTAAGLLPATVRSLLAQQTATQYPRRAPNLVKAALSTPNLGFPCVAPLFAGVLIPASAPSLLLRAESWTDFKNQVQQLSGTMRLTCFTAIQNMNRTWYYGAFQPGSASYFFSQTSDSSAFQKTFTQQQSAYSLVDLSVVWQSGQLVYSGCWVASSAPPPQSLVLGIQGFTQLTSQTSAMSSAQPAMQTIRVQSYPVLAGPQFAVLYQQGSGSAVVHDMPVAAFVTEVNTLSGNTLADVSYNPLEGHLTGSWRAPIAGAQFFVNQDWDTLQQMAQSSSAAFQTMAVYPDAPAFDDYFATNLAPYVMGYGYAVAKDGQIIANGGGWARSPHEASQPSLPFTADTRLTLASVSKAITGIALEKLALHQGFSLDAPFLKLLGTHAPNQPSAANITLRNLANMQSGLYHETQGIEGPPDLPSQYPDIWTEIDNYLQMPIAGPPGLGYYYDNTNYTILQGVIEAQSGLDYTDYVTRNVLTPAGLDPQVMSADPMQPNAPQTLFYGGPNDTNAGSAYGEFTLVGVSGWVSTARELVKLMIALRGDAVLPQAVVNEMFADSIGWNLPGNVPPAAGPAPHIGNFGIYYGKEGGLTKNNQSLQTFLVRLGEGYDLALLVNSSFATGFMADMDSICYNAFDARGLSSANLPAGGPAILSAVHAASYTPAVAPGSYVAILGSGFTTQAGTDWTGAIGSGTVLPQELLGVQVRVGTQNAYVEYVSPTQVNVLLPSTIPAGTANLELTTPAGGVVSSLAIQSVAPGLFTYPLMGRNYAAAVFGGTTAVIYVAAVGALPGVTSRPAKAGDAIQLYGTGMGPTNPPWPDGTTFNASYPAQDLTAFEVTIAGQPCMVLYAGVIEPGLFQINILVPTGLPAGDQPVVVTVSGNASPGSTWLTMG